MAILAGTVTGVVVKAQQNAKNNASSSGASGFATQFCIMMGETNNADSPDGFFTFEPAVGDTDAYVLFDLDKIADALDADENYKDAYSTTTPQKAGTNKYYIQLSTDNRSVIISFDLLGSSTKYNNVFTINYDYNYDRFIVTPSVNN